MEKITMNNHHQDHNHEQHNHKEHSDQTEHHHHHDHHAMMVEDFRKRFWISLIFTIPVLLLSPMIQSFFQFEWVFYGRLYLLFGLSSIIFFYGGWPFIKGLYDELKAKTPGMMTLIGVAIGTAYIYSGAVIFGLSGKMFFWELATLVDIMLVGHWIEMKSVMGASKALTAMAKLIPDVAHKYNSDESFSDVRVSDLEKDDVVLVKPGERIPVDGIIVEGESFVDESMLTGESI